MKYEERRDLYLRNRRTFTNRQLKRMQKKMNQQVKRWYDGRPGTYSA